MADLGGAQYLSVSRLGKTVDCERACDAEKMSPIRAVAAEKLDACKLRP